MFNRLSALLFKILVSLSVESVFNYLFELFESARVVVVAFFEHQSFSVVSCCDRYFIVGGLSHFPVNITGIFDVSVVVVWNKLNLAGNRVASGIYIVLLSNDDASDTAVAKIAIVN